MNDLRNRTMDNTGIRQYKNYIDHETRVKVIDGILDHDAEWSWFIDYITQSYDLSDVDTWKSFRGRYYRLADVYSFLIKIVSSCSTTFDADSALLSDLINVSKFYVGVLSKKECSASMHTTFGRLLFFTVYITKLENSSNGSEYIIDFGLFSLKNYWGLINTTFSENYNDEYDKVTELRLEDWGEPSLLLRNNIEHIESEYAPDFFDKYGNELFSANAFCYKRIIPDDNSTWEEQYLLEMIDTSINDGVLHSALIMDGSEYPELNKWTRTILEHMDSFFNHPYASFVIETIKYCLYHDYMSVDVTLNHFSLLDEYIKSHSENEVIDSSSFEVIAFMFKNKEIDDSIRMSDEFQSVIKKVNRFKTVSVLSEIQKTGFPLSKEQEDVLSEDSKHYFDNVEFINSVADLSTLLEKRNTVSYITNDQLESINDKFVSVIEDSDGIEVANLFYEYMRFLFEVNQFGLNINRKLLHQYMINTQMLWEYEHYEKQCSRLQQFDYTIKVKTEDIKEFNELLKHNPSIVAKAIRLASLDELFEMMDIISNHPIAYMLNTILLQSFFPVNNNSIDFKRHEIDKLLAESVGQIIKEKGYKLLNVLDTDVFVNGILDNYQRNVKSVIAIINDEEDLYNIVNSFCKTEKLIDYDTDLKLAHVTQLFPLLEIVIRNLARNEGYFPFKKNLNEFMQCNDPSSILREIIKDACSDAHGFEAVRDLYFVYNCMYNSNSLNIRNECVHGRYYLKGDELRFAFRTTMICILIIEQRLKRIQRNRLKELNHKK